jgi:hypothetical protein
MRLILFLAILLSIQCNVSAQSAFGFFAGLATPSDKINQIYNSDLINSQNMVGRLLRQGPDLGYTVGARLRFPLDDQIWFSGGIALARFPQSRIPVIDQLKPTDTLAIFTTVQNIIPISGGIHFQFNRGLISFYALGDISYNYIMNSVDVQYNSNTFPLPPNDDSYSRVGAGIGAGFDLKLPVFTANLEAKYSMMNMIGRQTGESEKNYFTLTLGILFGQTQIESEKKSK